MAEAIKRGIVETISTRSVCVFKADLKASSKPLLAQCYPSDPQAFAIEVETELYAQAIELHQQQEYI